jgi:hypothetical protein
MGLTVEQLKPGLAQTAAAVASARPAGEQQQAARQAQAKAFQRENGAAARSHTDVTAGQKRGG